jgi:hypothetical protein
MKLSKLVLLGCALAAAVITGAIAQVSISGTNNEFERSIFQVGILRISRESATTGITATAGGGQTNAYQLTFGLNRVTTVATAADSVKLPICQGGKIVIVINAAAANSMNVYGQTGEVINALSANAAYAIAANKMVIFACGTDGFWSTNLTA